MTLFVCLLSLLQFLSGSDDITLLFAGDAMQHDRQINAAYRDGGYDYSDCFRHVESYISEADYSVVNLECTLGGKPYRGYPCFSAPDSYALALKNSGFDLFLHANNHCLDRRDAGLVRTLDVFDRFGIPHIGTYRNRVEQKSNTPFIATVKGVKIAFLNYTYGTNGIKVQKDAVVNYIDKDAIAREIKAARLNGAELVVACMHWGVEYKLLPNKEQQQLADFLEGQGVDLIIGGHPHVVQPMEIRRNRKTGKDVLVVYSLGNFISAMQTADTRGGAMVKVRIGRTVDGKPYLKGAAYKLVFVQPPLKKGNYELIPTDREDLLRSDSKSNFNKFVSNAKNLFAGNNKGVEEDKWYPALEISPFFSEQDAL